ncbi:NAD-dependent epimerase/dehydratase family protein [Streptomyces nanshensis]|uniref:Reductase n=1 Tax=Streptomyces nanshensis TaxID=518642 RepID=A0A1E7KZE5_9ACTN|nr:NAD(P)-dependent oxidoreductase [Streptomyces nanshensis]OEV09284.1 reductase [Streptomyces nanshensis]
MRVLLLGASGYLGTSIADRLLADPGVHLFTLGRGEDANVRFDLAADSPGALVRFLDAVDPGVVINCAGTPHGTAADLIRGNVVATATVCESLRRSHCQARLVHIGCAAEYGPSHVGSPLAEDSVPIPWGPYGLSKLAATQLVLASGLNAIVLRVFSPVGPYGPASSPLRQLAHDMFRAVARGDSELRVPGLDEQCDFVDVRDVARAVHSASLATVQGVVNIGSGTAVRLHDAATILAQLAGYEGKLLGPEPATTGRSNGDRRQQQADIHAADNRLGWRPRIGLEESLGDLWREATCLV